MEDTTKTKTIATNEELARAAVDEASEKLGSDIVLLETGGVSSFADYFVIISGETDRSEDVIIKKFEKPKSWINKKLSGANESQIENLINILEERSIWQKFGF